jgi:hypothetical protein
LTTIDVSDKVVRSIPLPETAMNMTTKEILLHIAQMIDRQVVLITQDNRAADLSAASVVSSAIRQTAKCLVEDSGLHRERPGQTG